MQPKEGFGFWFPSCCGYFVVAGCFFIPGKKATKKWIDILSRFLSSQRAMKKFWILLSSVKTTRFCEMQQQKLHQPIFYRYVKFVPSEQQVC